MHTIWASRHMYAWADQAPYASKGFYGIQALDLVEFKG